MLDSKHSMMSMLIIYGSEVRRPTKRFRVQEVTLLRLQLQVEVPRYCTLMCTFVFCTTLLYNIYIYTSWFEIARDS